MTRKLGVQDSNIPGRVFPFTWNFIPRGITRLISVRMLIRPIDLFLKSGRRRVVLEIESLYSRQASIEYRSSNKTTGRRLQSVSLDLPMPTVRGPSLLVFFVFFRGNEPVCWQSEPLSRCFVENAKARRKVHTESVRDSKRNDVASSVSRFYSRNFVYLSS